MRKEFLSFSPPMIGDEEIAAVVESLRSGWITTGPRVEQFEADFRRYTGAEASLALNSCTAALHVGLKALGIGPGDRVVSTPMTFVSTINVIEQVGAQPLLVDVEPDTLNIDPARVERAVAADRTIKAILPVHLHGHPCEMDPIVEIARRHGLSVIEDAAHSLPARYRGHLVGAPWEGVTSLAAFSFYATKNLTTGEGGMLVGPPEVIEKARVWALHGMSRDAFGRYGAGGSWFYEVTAPGFKYNMPDLQAAIGIEQLKRLDQMQQRRRAIVEQYDEAFAGIKEIERPVERPHVQSAWHIYALRLRLESLTIDRARFIEELRQLNIGASVHFIPVHLHAYHRKRYGYQPEDFPVALREYERMVSIPLSPKLEEADVADVVEAVKDVVTKHRR